MSNELKPCPFCGSKCVNDTSDPVGPDYFWVCPCCVSCGPIARTIEEATDGWNNRNNIDPEKEQRDNLERHNKKVGDINYYQAGYLGAPLGSNLTEDQATDHHQGAKDRREEREDRIDMEPRKGTKLRAG